MWCVTKLILAELKLHHLQIGNGMERHSTETHGLFELQIDKNSTQTDLIKKLTVGEICPQVQRNISS